MDEQRWGRMAPDERDAAIRQVLEQAAAELGALRGAVGDYLAQVDSGAGRRAPARRNALERLREAYAKGGGS